MIAPMTWWVKLNAKLNATNRPDNIFYENDCSGVDVESFRHQDHIEQMAHLMTATPGYGYHFKDAKFVS